jgi:hypothetical protein
MEIEKHVEKMTRLKGTRERLDPLQDFELWMWTSMTVATHGLNAALHHLGLTLPGPYYSHQIPGVFIEREKGDEGWRKVLATPGDVIHIGLPPFEGEIPPRLQEGLVHLDIIESFREPYVRGNELITEETVGACQLAYERCIGVLEEILGGPGGQGA